MTKEAFLRAMENVADSINKHGDIEYLCEILDPYGRLTDDEVVTLLKSEVTSDNVQIFLEKQKLFISALGKSFEACGLRPGCYYVVGSDLREKFGDGSMSYIFEDLYCISTHGDLYKLCMLKVSGLTMDYNYKHSLSVEPYSRRAKWQARLNILCETKDSPLHKYLEYFQQ